MEDEEDMSSINFSFRRFLGAGDPSLQSLVDATLDYIEHNFTTYAKLSLEIFGSNGSRFNLEDRGYIGRVFLDVHRFKLGTITKVPAPLPQKPEWIAFEMLFHITRRHKFWRPETVDYWLRDFGFTDSFINNLSVQLRFGFAWD